MSLEVWNDIDAKVGDAVEIEVADGLLLKSAFNLYGLPMLLFIAAGAAAYFVSRQTDGNADLWAALAGLGAVIGYYWSGFSGRKSAGLEARIVRIQTQHSGVNCRMNG